MRKLIKISITFVMTIAVLLSMTVVAMAAEVGEINVTGNGIVSVEPDLATLYVSIDTNATTAEEAQQQNVEISSRVQEAFKSMGVKEEDIKTNNYQVYPRYKYDNETEVRKLIGFEVSNNLYITTSDVKNTGKYLDAAIKAGATGNDGVTFSVKDPRKYYNQALALSLQNANNSAQTIATALGSTLGKAIRVEENYSSASYARNEAKEISASADARYAGGASAAEIRYDKIQISANVNVTYQYN